MKSSLRSCSDASPTSRGQHRGMFLSALQVTGPFFCLLLLQWSVVVRGDSLCEGCLNGGKLLMPNNIFGYCRCKCSGDYKGPKCQFLYKRSSSSPTKYLSEAIQEAIANGGGGGGGGKSVEDNWALLPDGESEEAFKTPNWILSETSKATDKRLMPKRLDGGEERSRHAQLRGLLDKLSDIAQSAKAKDLGSY